MRRRAFLSLLSAGSAAPAWFRYGEPHWFEVTRTRVEMAVRARRILHVSDLHVSDGMTAEELEEGLKAGLAMRPDLICLTGDFVSDTSGFDEAGLVRMLRRASATAPCYAVLGNHDGGAWLARHGGSGSTARIGDIVARSGVALLRNEAVVEGGLNIVGLEDLWGGAFDAERAFGGLSGGESTVVLCHNPDGKERMRHLPWQLMLSGHTHGGQGQIPGLKPLWAPVRDKRFISGLHPWAGRKLFITRGLGSPKHVRAFCRPELSLLEVGT